MGCFGGSWVRGVVGWDAMEVIRTYGVGGRHGDGRVEFRRPPNGCVCVAGCVTREK